MICSSLPSITGLECHPINDDGSVAMIETAFCFEDGDSFPVYVQKIGGQVRFFDDGGVLLHFMGRGLQFENHRRTRFIKAAGEPFGVSLNEIGEFEIWAPADKAPTAFSNYISALVSITSWEKQQVGTQIDIAHFIDEVGLYLRAWKPKANLRPEPQYTGISGNTYTLDFDLDGKAVVAITTHPNSVSSALRKLLDIRSSPANSKLQTLVVLDDRFDQEAAKRESLVLESVASVLPMTRLQKNAGSSQRAQ